MTPPEVASALAARRHRVGHIRRRVLGIATGTFLAATGVVFEQLVTGHDPALASNRTSSGTTSDNATGATSSAGQSSQQVTPMTSSQS